MNENSEQIQKIASKFLQFGIKSISMDDIAQEIGISKKKLYQIYDDKTDIVNQCITCLKDKMRIICKEFSDSNLNAIEKEIEHRNKYLKTYLRIKPSFIYDLKKFYPDIYADFKNFKKDLIYNSTITSIKQGIKEGYYRDDVDPDFIAKLSLTLTFSILHPEMTVISESDLISEKFSNQYFQYHMNGICSENGRQLFNKLFTNNNQE